MADLTTLPGKQQKTPELFIQTDTTHEDFHVTGVLTAEGTVRLGMHLGDSSGNRSQLDARRTVRAMLKHFGDKVKRVEWKLSREQTLDEHTTTVDAQLESFNEGWRRAVEDRKLHELAQFTGDQQLRQQRIQSLAALSTPVGTAIALSQVGYRIRVTDTLGKEGRFVSATVVFEKY